MEVSKILMLRISLSDAFFFFFWHTRVDFGLRPVQDCPVASSPEEATLQAPWEWNCTAHYDASYYLLNGWMSSLASSWPFFVWFYAPKWPLWPQNTLHFKAAAFLLSPPPPPALPPGPVPGLLQLFPLFFLPPPTYTLRMRKAVSPPFCSLYTKQTVVSEINPITASFHFYSPFLHL